MERQKFVHKNEHILSVVNSDYISMNSFEHYLTLAQLIQY